MNAKRKLKETLEQQKMYLKMLENEIDKEVMPQ